jgi:hypothetical protein
MAVDEVTVKFKVVFQQYIPPQKKTNIRDLAQKFINFVTDLVTQYECVPGKTKKCG